MPALTIPDENTVQTFSAAAVTINISFSLFAKADLRILVGATELSQSDFTFAGVVVDGGFDGGVITLNTAAAAAGVVWRDVRPQRSTDFAPAAYVRVPDLDSALDKVEAKLQDAHQNLERTLRGRPGETIAMLPLPATRANKFLGFDAGGVLSFFSATAGLFSGVSELISYAGTWTGAVIRSLRARLMEWKSVKDFGAVGDGVADDTAAIQAAVDSGKPYSQYYGGAVPIFFPAGTYKISSKIDLAGCHGLKCYGAGNQATEIKPTGNFEAFSAIGTSGVALQSVEVSDMLINHIGKANNAAFGIKAKYTNSCTWARLKFYGCRRGIDFTKVWQDQCTSCRVVGTGALQNYSGLWFNETDAGEPNNAVIVDDFYAEYYEYAGVRAINAQGSKFNSGECNAGTYGFYAGDPTVGNYGDEFMHIGTWLCDSNSSHNWVFKQGAAATPIRKIQGANLWSGKAGDSAFWFEGMSMCAFGVLQAHGCNKSGIVAYNSAKISVGVVVLEGNNVGNDVNAADILVNNSTFCCFNNIISDPLLQKSILEAGTSDSNEFWGIQAIDGVVIVGANTTVNGVRGYVTNSHGTWTMTNAGGSTQSFNHFMSRTPQFGEVSIQPRLVPSELGLTGFKITAISSTQVTIVGINGAAATAPSGSVFLDYQININRPA